MKTYCVVYDVPPMGFDVNIKAESRKEAIAKVKEVIPDAFNLKAWEVVEKPNAYISNAGTSK